MLNAAMRKGWGKLTLAVLGSLIYAVGINVFMVPLGLYTGGMLGLAQLLRTMLLNALGGNTDNLKIDLTTQLADCWQAMLLCSDGFWEFVPQGQMQRTLRYSHSCGEWLAQMEKSALKNGRRSVMDNYSAIAVWFRTDEPKISSL